MVSTLFKSTLREIRQSLGRYLAIMGIIGLGVGFFAGLRMCQPAMEQTAVVYLEEQQMHDFRLLSSLGFTQEDVESFRALEGIENAEGAVYTEFLWQNGDQDTVLISHMLLPGIDMPKLTAGRMPEKANECLGDSDHFKPEDIGRTIKVSENNDEDTRELLACREYTLVGLAATPLYLNYERGTASVGNGSISAFVLMPPESFVSDVWYEIYLTVENAGEAYSEEYGERIDAMEPAVKALQKERAKIRYDDIYEEAMEEIRDGEQELADGWEEYRTERADAEQELADALKELQDGEKEYADGLADYEQGQKDYLDGIAAYEKGAKELEEGWGEYHVGKARAEKQLREGKAPLEEGEKQYAEGLKQWEDGQAALQVGFAQLEAGESQLAAGKQELDAAKTQLDNAKAQLEAGQEGYRRMALLYQSGQALAAAFGLPDAETFLAAAEQNAELAAQADSALAAQGSSLEAFKAGWGAAKEQLGGAFTPESLSALQAQLEQGEEEYIRGKAEYEKGLEEYGASALLLKENRETLEAGQKELEMSKAELDAARQQLDAGWDAWREGEKQAEKELEAALKKLEDAEIEIDKARSELLGAKEDLDKAPQELADARQELDDGWKEYEDGLAEAEQEFADAEEELREGEQEIADAYLELEDLKNADTYTLTRSENRGYASFENDIAIIAAVSLVFPVFFFLVAALVCMTTMKRMVDEQRTQIGVLKAIGYSRKQIIGKYLFYSGSAAITGSVAGYALGNWGMPLVIWEIYGMMYGFAPLEHVFHPLLAAVSFGAALLCSMGATYLSCRLELTRQAAELIRPKTPKAGKRIFLEYIGPIWKRMDFLHKVSVRNVMRYKSRLVMMILGIGGCTALLITGFGLRDSIANIANDQYGEITLYDYAVTFQEEKTPEEAAEFLTEKGWPASAGLLVHSGNTDLITEAGTKSVYLVLPARGSLEGFVSLHNEGAPIPTPGEGEAVINRGLADRLKVRVGDTVQLRDDDMRAVEVTVSGICENYMFDYVYASPETYLSQLGETPKMKTLFVLQANPEADPYKESVLLADDGEVSSITVNEATRSQLTAVLSRLNIIIIVVVICAGALAFIVLYNLTNINITERLREIATIKVLGFYRGEVAAYVFREIYILSALASIAGLFMGKALHAFVMAQVRVDGMFFPVRIRPASYLISVALTMLFTLLITNCMRPRLNRIDMAESLKSIE